jgi:hypothetical protein
MAPFRGNRVRLQPNLSRMPSDSRTDARTAGQIVIVEGSTNLSTWLPLQTNTLGSGPFYFSDPNTGAFRWRFYRLRQLP